ncbi:MAG TPA: lipoyl synthase, partial [Dehalococcoidia bacterium]|nr:lipoyl synthase [Dehalococcoidia bacterium]
CEEARCPNIGECFENGTATFLILGNVCTRACTFCAVSSGRPIGLDTAEPLKVARAASRLGLRHAVVTSVTRDDLPDGGASIFAATIRAVRRLSPGTSVEVLIPDFQGSHDALAIVMAAGPDVLNHNIETVPRLYRDVRPKAVYGRSLELLARAGEMDAGVITKSGLMVGLGEEHEELLAAMADLVAAGCRVLTIGQYLQPTPRHRPVACYYHPDEFAALAREGRRLGFRHVEAGPLVRSSYHAERQIVNGRDIVPNP